MIDKIKNIKHIHSNNFFLIAGPCAIEGKEMAFEIAEKLASKTPLAMWVTKETLNYSRDHTVKESLENVALWNAATLHKEDVMSTMMSKMQKKKPEYRNLRDKNFLKHKANKN